MASHILFIISVNCGFQLMGCVQVNLNLTPLSFVNLSGFKPQALTILLKLSISPLFGLSHKLAYGFLTSLVWRDISDSLSKPRWAKNMNRIVSSPPRAFCLSCPLINIKQPWPGHRWWKQTSVQNLAIMQLTPSHMHACLISYMHPLEN